MGNLLVAPVTEKETHRGKTPDGELQYAVSSMQGWRVHMEDAHICQPSLYAEERIRIPIAVQVPNSSNAAAAVTAVAAASAVTASSASAGGSADQKGDESDGHGHTDGHADGDGDGSNNANAADAASTTPPATPSSMAASSASSSTSTASIASASSATATTAPSSASASSSSSMSCSSPTNSKREECGGGANETECHVKKAKTVDGDETDKAQITTANTTTTATTTQYRKIDLPNHSLFAVFDGHGGSFAAQYSGLNFVRVLSRQPSFVKYAHFVQELHTRDMMEKEVNGNVHGNGVAGNNINMNGSMNGTGNENEVDATNEDTVMANANHDSNVHNATNNNNNSNIGSSPVQQAQIHRKGLELLEQAFRDAFLDLDREIWRVVNHLKNEGSKFPRSGANNAAEGNNNNEHYEYNNDLDHDRSYGDSEPNDEKMNNATNDNGDNDDDDNDDEYNYEYEYSNQDSGTTAVAVLLTPQYIICANAGDSRSVYSKQGHCTIPLSYDHKPDDEEEERRIVDAGGFVRVGRVDGDLAVSRGLGDFRFKEHELYRSMGTTVVEDMPHLNSRGGGEKRNKRRGGGGGNCSGEEDVLGQNYDADGDDAHRNSEILPDDQKVSPIPDIIVQKRDREVDEFVVIACDGIFDVQTNHECISLTAEIFQEGEDDMGLVCEEILDLCLEKGSKDNMTALVIKFPAQEIGQGGGVMKRRELRQEQEEEENQATN